TIACEMELYNRTVKDRTSSATRPGPVLEDFAALGGAVRCGRGLGPALALAGILALARAAPAPAGALALAGVDAVALVGRLRVSRSGQRAGGEHRCRSNDVGLLHLSTPSEGTHAAHSTAAEEDLHTHRRVARRRRLTKP